MSRLLLSLPVLFLCVQLSRAQNLISNSGFEERNTCTELHAVCAPEGWFRIPLDPVSALRGTAGFVAGNHHDNIVMENVKRPGINRTYIYTKLLCPLEKGKEYSFTASFRTASDQNFYRINLLWTSFEPFRFQNRIARETERNTIKPENKISDQSFGWKDYNIRFIATGEEKYVLIGNLEREIFPGKPTAQQRSLIIYEVDNVALYPTDESVKACAERDANIQNLYLNNYRHTPGKFIDEEGELPAAPKEEIKKDTPPLPPPVVVEPPPPPPVVNDTLVIPDVLFKFDKKDLNPAFAYRLDTLIDKIRNKTFKRIEILGHTDSLGNNKYNQKLSIDRAEVVKKYLIDRLKYPADIIVTKGFAATLPVSTNSNSTGRQKNRRVEIVLVK
jgi:outer membrane protein OmpA-like peptidoglycan-associated protein